MASGFARAIRDEAWGSYQHENEVSLDLDTDLMRLATGGSAQ
jgi:FMN reductase